MARENESDRRPLAAPGGSVQVSSGTLLGVICSKFLVCCTASGNLTFRTLDGTSTTLTGLQTGTYSFDLQADTVTWTGTMTVIGLYHI